MNHELEMRIKAIEEEILALKTASIYSSTRNASYSAGTNVRTGIYQINYRSQGEPIVSVVCCGKDQTNWGIAYPRTPSSNAQVVEIDTDYYDEDRREYVTGSVPLVIISNVPVINIQRIN